MFELNKLTPQFFQQLKDWQNQGNRSVTIRLETEYNCYQYAEVELYDADAAQGTFVSPEMPLPTTAELLVQRTIKAAQITEEVF